MAGILEAGAGIILQQLWNVILEAISEARKYEDVLKNMETRIKEIMPVLEEIKKLEKIEIDPHEDEKIRELWEKVKAGEELVKKCCSKTKCCSSSCFKMCCSSCCFKRSDCRQKLQDLDDSLGKFYQSVLPLKQIRLTIATHVGVMAIGEKVQEQTTRIIDAHVHVKGIDEKVEQLGIQMTETREFLEMVIIKFAFVDVGAIRDNLNEILDKLTGVEVTGDDPNRSFNPMNTHK